MTIQIEDVHGLEILDSRGRPTVTAILRLADGSTYSASAPSGASTGSGEAVELRDGDSSRFGGMGTLTAVSHINGELKDTLAGRGFGSLADLDGTLRDADGTPNKGRLGANAIVAVSIAASRAFASTSGLPLWRYLTAGGVTPTLPVPHFNVVNGGAHAANSLDFQEFMLAPIGAPSYADALRAGAETYARLSASLRSAGHSIGLGDEGGFAPDVADPTDVLSLLVGAITDAGYQVGRDGICIAMDPAASEFYHEGTYRLMGKPMSSSDMVTYYEELVDRFPIWSIEDGLAEDDWSGWDELTKVLGDRIQLVGDDIFVTNPRIIEDAITRGVANAALIKVNQIGTVSETLEALEVCRRGGFAAMISHRSGETPDAFIADLAVGSGCGQLKSGAPARGERIAKYNRLLEIADQHPELSLDTL